MGSWARSIIGLLRWRRRHRRHPPIGPGRLTSSGTEPEGRCTSTVRERRTGSAEQQSQPTEISRKLIYSSQRKTTLESRLEAPMEKISTFLSFCLMFPALFPHLARRNRKDQWEEKFDLVKGDRRRHIKPVLQGFSSALFRPLLGAVLNWWP